MGKYCLYKLLGNIPVTCSIPSNGVKDLYLMHAEDVRLTTDVLNGAIAGVVFSPGARSYRIEGFKQNIQITSAIRTLEASTRLDFSVTFKIPSEESGTMANLRNERAFMNGKFYALVVLNSSAAYFIGNTSPLECSGADYDSNTNGGLSTVTLTAPEGSAGNYRMGIIQEAIATIISKSV